MTTTMFSTVILLNIMSVYSCSIIINEFNADNFGFDNKEYIELYNTDSKDINLDQYVVVLYSNRYLKIKASKIFPLKGYNVTGNGYFLLGMEAVVPTPDFIFGNDTELDVLKNGEDAIALYLNVDNSSYTVGMNVTTHNLIDAVVYDKYFSSRHSKLVNSLIPGQSVLQENYKWHPDHDESLSRCGSQQPLNVSGFQLSVKTPGSENNCTDLFPKTTEMTLTPTKLPQNVGPLVINELNPDNPMTDYAEFVELFSTNSSTMRLDNYTLVFYNLAVNEAYMVVNLAGNTTNDEGYFLLGFGDVMNAQVNLTGPIQNGPDAVVLYYGDPGQYSKGMTVTSYGLAQALVYSNKDKPVDDIILSTLNVDRVIHENDAYLESDESISLCSNLDYKLTLATPGTANNCSYIPPAKGPKPVRPLVVINELNAENFGLDKKEFIELYDGGKGNTPLEGYTLVLFNGNYGTSYKVWNLNGYSTNDWGYFVIGSSHVVPRPDLVFRSSFHIIQNGIDAVALYSNWTVKIHIGMKVTDEDLVDAIVYGTYNSRMNHSLSVLMKPNQNLLIEDPRAGIEFDKSLSRCNGMRVRMSEPFQLINATPGWENKCLKLPQIVVNEIDANEFSRNQEFIEIYDGGVGNTTLEGVSVVLFDDRTDLSYWVIDLSGQATSPDGYFTLKGGQSGTENMFFRHGPGAVAWYLAPPTQFPPNTKAVTNNLIDVVIFGSQLVNDDTDMELVSILAPGQKPVIDHDRNISSIQRCDCCDQRNMTQFGIDFPTPGEKNSAECSREDPTLFPGGEIRINEINADQPGHDDAEFIELYDGGKGNVELTNLVLVLYTGSNGRAYRAFDLHGKSTDINGYFLVSAVPINGVAPDYKVSHAVSNWLQNGADAVVLHRGDINDFDNNQKVSTRGVIDAVVYGTNDDPAKELLKTLTPGQTQVNEDPNHAAGDEVIVRCHSQKTLDLGAFSLTTVLTPKSKNHCHIPKIVINEVVFGRDEDTREFIELRSTEYKTLPLNNLVLVLFDKQGSYYSLELNNIRADKNGLVALGNPWTVRPDIYFASDTIKNGGDDGYAIALYFNKTKQDFPEGSNATRDGLVDALVYGKSSDGGAATHLMKILTPGRHVITVNTAGSSPKTSISRCTSISGSVSQRHVNYVAAALTPQMPNKCTPMTLTSTVPQTTLATTPSTTPSKSSSTPGTISTSKTPVTNCTKSTIFISEINADSPGLIGQEFLELYDGGRGNTSLDGLVLVFYSGDTNDNGTAHLVFDLMNNSTDENGFFLVGASKVPGVDLVLPTHSVPASAGGFGPDAVALYMGNISSYTIGMQATDAGIVDALVYGTNNKTGKNMIGTLMPPGQRLVTESAAYQSGDESISRCNFCKTRDSASYVLAHPTPKAANNCSLTPEPSTSTTSTTVTVPSTTVTTKSTSPSMPSGKLPKVVINEVNADNPNLDIKEFIELQGPPGADLTGFAIVLYSYSKATTKISHTVTINLENKKINKKGLFLISAYKNFKVLPDLVLDDNLKGIIQNGIEAVVLYDRRDPSFKNSDTPIPRLVQDVLVYTTSYWDRLHGKEILQVFNLNATRVFLEDKRFHLHDESISRCRGKETKDLSMYIMTFPTPGEENSYCPSNKYQGQFQLKLPDAKCNIWNNNDSLIYYAKEMVTGYINKYTRGFSIDYITDVKVFCGSVILNFIYIANSDAQRQQILNAYLAFLNDSNTVYIGEEKYNIDSSCYSKCYVDPAKRIGEKNSSSGVAVAVGVTCAVVLVIIIIVIVIVIRRKRGGLLHFQMARLDNNDDEDEDWVGGAQASFENPLYAKLTG